MFESPKGTQKVGLESPEHAAEKMRIADNNLSTIRDLIADAHEEIAAIGASIEKLQEEIAKASPEDIAVLDLKLLDKKTELREWREALKQAEDRLKSASDFRDESETEFKKLLN